MKKVPRDYQLDAISAVIEGFKTADRGKLILPCGSGKTLVAMWIVQTLKSKRTLVLVPSLSLLKQIKDEWTTEGEDIPRLCVCSENDIDDNDSLTYKMSEVDGNATTDSTTIKEFLQSHHDNLIIYSTYQSLSKISIALPKGFSFDLVICDEAHRTAGQKDRISGKSLIHSNEAIPSAKRLYMTATKRVFSETKREDPSIFCMNNEEIFGSDFYTMSFGDAINQGILIDYKIIAVALNCAEVQKSLGIVKIDRKSSPHIIRWANAYALEKFMNDNGASHVVTYHSSIKKAKEFHDDYAKISLNPAYHVNGAQSAKQRKSTMDKFATDKKAVITNARCLTEGIDVPSIDAVFFCDPKNSKIDILQATGRALRRADHKDKKIGYVIIPLFHSPQSEVDKEIKKSSFSNLMTVVRAIATEDSTAYQKHTGNTLDKDSPFEALGFSSDKFEIQDLSHDQKDFSSIRDALYLDIVCKFDSERSKEFHLLKLRVKRLDIRSLHAYKKAKKEGKLPKSAPWQPDRYFKSTGWIDWGDFLGTGIKKKKNFLPFEEARELIKSLGFKSKIEYDTYVIKQNKAEGNCRLPSTPHKTYDNDWVNWEYFLGKDESVKKSVVRISFDECKAFLKPLKISGKRAYHVIKKLKKLPINIPWKPEQIYKNEWKGWPDYLGNDHS